MPLVPSRLVIALSLFAGPQVACDSGDGSPADATSATDAAATDANAVDTSAADATTTTSPDAGSDASVEDTGGVGPGLPTDATVSCLIEVADAQAFYYGVKTKCMMYSGAAAPASKSLLETVCTAQLAGTLVESCPTDDVVAYCQGTQFIGSGNVDVTAAVYTSTVTPDADWVARNLLAICQTLPQAFDADDAPFDAAACTGTMVASIDGVETRFDDHLTCLARTDGARTTYLVRGAKNPNSNDLQELTLKVIKDAATDAVLFVEVLQPAYGYLEGGTAAGAFGFPVAGETPTFTATRYALDGTGFAATFELGKLSTSPFAGGTERTVTAGSLDITLE